MHRRNWLKRTGWSAGAVGISTLLGGRLMAAERQIKKVQGSSHRSIKITDVRTVLTAPAGIRLVVVKVLTNQPGLYGLGCATFTQRPRVGYFKHLRRQTSTPIAMGELFNNPNEWVSLVSERLIDFIRVHISQVGGLTVARKMAAMCEFFAVRTAWHGPGDVSPVGHAANVHLDLAVPNFGIQEARQFTKAEEDVFPGCPELKNGYYHVSDRPGLGIDLDEELAAKFPIQDDPSFDLFWGNVRRRDGTVQKP